MNPRGILLCAIFAAVAVIGLAAFLVASPGRVVEANGGNCAEGIEKFEAPPNLNSVVLDEGTVFCVKAGNGNTGRLTADGVKSLCGYLIDAGIITKKGDCKDVSNYVIYSYPSPTPTPTPTPEPTPTPIVIPEHCGMYDRLPDAPDCFTSTPVAEPTPVITPVASSAFIAPAGFPNTGGAPACDSGDGGLPPWVFLLGGAGLGMPFGAALARRRIR